MKSKKIMDLRRSLLRIRGWESIKIAGSRYLNRFSGWISREAALWVGQVLVWHLCEKLPGSMGGDVRVLKSSEKGAQMELSLLSDGRSYQ